MTGGEPTLFDRRYLRAHDLPPRWDGHPVTWGDWENQPTVVFICPPPRTSDRCRRCGSHAPNETNRGTVRHTTHQQVLAVLTVFRCPDCFLDTVIDGIGAQAQAWVLDEADYTDEGSWG
jgi:hypothetical protein